MTTYHTVLPPQVQEALRAAAAKPQEERARAINQAIAGARLMYPELFRKQEEEGDE